MAKVEQKIQDIEKKIEQKRQQVRDLKAMATRQERKDDTRRKILYGAAFLSAVKAQAADAQEKSLARLHAHIRNPKDRAFLGLPVLKDVSRGIEKAKAGLALGEGQNLPFDT